MSPAQRASCTGWKVWSDARIGAWGLRDQVRWDREVTPQCVFDFPQDSTPCGCEPPCSGSSAFLAFDLSVESTTHKTGSMNNQKIFQPAPEPAEPKPEPAPEPTPRRRRFIQPVFSTRGLGAGRTVRMLVATTLCVLSWTAQGQNETPPRTLPPVPQQPGQPRPQAQEGWVMFNDKVGQDLGMQDDQLRKLRDVDAKYHKDYSALGETPWTNPGYRALTDQRNSEVRSILGTELYDRWQMRYSTSAPSGMKPGTGPGTTTATDPKNTRP
jgi:hypothetical protein